MRECTYSFLRYITNLKSLFSSFLWRDTFIFLSFRTFFHTFWPYLQPTSLFSMAHQWSCSLKCFLMASCFWVTLHTIIMYYTTVSTIFCNSILCFALYKLFSQWFVTIEFPYTFISVWHCSQLSFMEALECLLSVHVYQNVYRFL